jgi:hypothetical protein
MQAYGHGVKSSSNRNAITLKHDPEKCVAVFRKDHAPTKT